MRVYRRLILAAASAVLLTAWAPAQPVSSGAMKAYEISTAVAGQSSALAWHGGVIGRDVIHLQWLDAHGLPEGAPLKLTDGVRRAYEPDLRLVGGEPLLAWYEKDDAGKLTAWLSRFDVAGRAQWKQPLSFAGGQARNPVVRVGKTVIHVAWIETTTGAQPQVRAARFDLGGHRLGAIQAVGEAGTDTWNLNAALDARGIFYVVYDARLEDRANELRLSAIRAHANRTIRISPDDGHASLYPDLGISADGQAALTWYDERDGNQEIYLAVEPLAALARGKLPAVRRITHSQANSTGAYLAWNGHRLGLVWCDEQPGQKELYSQAFTHAGKPVAAIQRLTHSEAQSSIPSIRALGAGFLIGWNEYEATPDGAHGKITSSSAMSERLTRNLTPVLAAP